MSKDPEVRSKRQEAFANKAKALLAAKDAELAAEMKWVACEAEHRQRQEGPPACTTVSAEDVAYVRLL